MGRRPEPSRGRRVSLAVAGVLVLVGACERGTASTPGGAAPGGRGASEAFPAFCSAATSEAVCAATDDVTSFWGDRPLVDTSAWNRTWILEPGRAARAGQGDSVVSVLFDGEAPATFQKALDLSSPVMQQTIVNDPAPGGRPHADIAEDDDASDGVTKRWIDVGGRRMLHLATRDFDGLQFVEPFEGDVGVYVELTLASGRFETLQAVAESLEVVR